jgi:hypothetical protein
MSSDAIDAEARRAGARFIDANKRDQGHAGSVTRRPPGLAPLTVIDVVAASPGLFAFLTHLDNSRLLLRHPQTGATLYEFRWASGYADGSSVRIQGVLT